MRVCKECRKRFDPQTLPICLRKDGHCLECAIKLNHLAEEEQMKRRYREIRNGR